MFLKNLLRTLTQSFIKKMYCVIPENTHAHPKEDEWKFQGAEGRGLKAQFFKGTCDAYLEFLEGWEGSG